MTILTTYIVVRKSFSFKWNSYRRLSCCMDGWRKCDKDESHVVHILNFNIYRSIG